MDAELITKQPPYSLEAEQAVLGSILIDSRCLPDVIEAVSPKDFYLQQNREIFETVYTMFNFSESVDPVTVLEKMRERGVYHDNSREYVMQLMEIWILKLLQVINAILMVVVKFVSTKSSRQLI